MSSPYLFGSYKSYKAGTTKVLNWLYDNAQKYGKLPAEVQDKAEGSGVRSKKPKKGLDKTDNLTKPVPVKEFTKYAEAIAASKTDIKIPLWVTSMIKEVIYGRRKYARWFSKQSGDTKKSDFEESNASHQHFIGVLENVLKILSSCKGFEKPTAEGSEDFDDGDPLSRLTNAFDALEVESDTEHTMTDPVDSPGKVKVRYEEEPSTEETAWLIYCFFEDFNVVRNHLKDLWTAYKNGDVDLTAAALSTNTAFERFQRSSVELMLELASTLPVEYANQLKSYDSVQGFLFQVVAIQRGVNPDARLRPRDHYNYRLFDIADWTCLPVYIMLNSFLDVIHPNQVPICKPGHFGRLNMTEEIVDPRQKFSQDQIVLFERLLPEFVFLSHMKDRQTNKYLEIPGEDELTKGVLKMVRTKEIPVWLVLAFQVQLDIHYTLLGNTSRPQAELSTAAIRTVNSLRSYLDFSKDMQIVNWPKSNDKVLENIIMDCEMYARADFLDAVRTKTYSQLGLAKPSDSTFVLLKRHPVLCGMILFRLKLQVQEAGITIAGAWGALPVILHLYNAARQEGALEKHWLDLEALILANGADRIFVGSLPEKPQDYLKRFLIVMGYSATTLSTNRRPKIGAVASKRGPREMLGVSAITDVYRNRYISKTITRPEFTLNAIENLLAESAQELSNDAEHLSKTGPASSKKSFKGTRSGRGFKKQVLKGSKKFAKSQKLTTIQLLHALENCMAIESFGLNVDYISLHMRSFRLLRNIRTDMDSTFVKYFGPMYSEKESELPFLVGYIFHVVSGGSQASELVLGQKLLRKVETGSRILIEASQIMQKLIEKEGDVEIKNVKEVCSSFDGIELE